jgi:carbon monoxide dehydrogenase subunit G
VRVEESFVIAEPRERLWEFFEHVDRVARCVPGVESVEVIDDEQSKVRVTQAVGPMTATFDLKMRITEREPLERMQFTAIGRAVKGAAGNIRTTNTVRLTDVEEGTRVVLESDLAMGGVLGSVGQKVVAKQAGQVTKAFSDALERAIKGEGVAATEAAEPTAAVAEAPVAAQAVAVAPAPAGAATVQAPSVAAPPAKGDARTRRLAVMLAAAIGVLALRRLAGRRGRS